MYPQLSEEGFSAPQVGEWLDLWLTAQEYRSQERPEGAWTAAA